MNLDTLYTYTKDLHILYVEDEKDIATQTAEFLNTFFASVTLCENGKIGLETYKKDSNLFDIVITDILMPIMTGLEMIENILSINQRQQIIVTSAQNETQLLLKLINLGISSFLIKPIHDNQLIQTLYNTSYNIHNEKISLQYQIDMAKSNAHLEEEVQKQTKELKHQFYTDYLTGLKNRMSLNIGLEKKIYKRVAIVDIDRLQFINDLYGTTVGNLVIKQFANFLSHKVLDKNLDIYRASGDEFAICSKNGSDQEFIEFITKLSESVINLPLYIDKLTEEIYIDATIGLSCNKDHLMTHTDIALKYAKTNQKPLVIYEDSMNTLKKMQNTLTWKHKIQYALDNNNIVPVFQPIVDSKGKILKYEALMRIKESSVNGENLITPYFFLDIAIQTKLYAKISRVLIIKTLQVLKQQSDIVVSINLTYSDLTDKKLINIITDTLEDNSTIGSRLIFEIVESEDIKNYEMLQLFIKKFRKYGVKIAIDDFGSGYSNFGHIIKMKPDYIKIDGSLIKNIDTDVDAQSIVKAITQIAKELGVKLIAEYVHSKEVLKVLRRYKIDEYQGYYFYEPSYTLVKDKNMV